MFVAGRKSEIFKQKYRSILSCLSACACVRAYNDKRSKWKRNEWIRTAFGTCLKRIALKMQAKINGNESRYHSVSEKSSALPLEIHSTYNTVCLSFSHFHFIFSVFALYFVLPFDRCLVATTQHQTLLNFMRKSPVMAHWNHYAQK